MNKHIIIPALAVVLSLTLASCSDSERRIPALTKNMATVVIKLGLPDDHAAAQRSVLDRIFHFFVPDAVAQTAPATFSTISVNVTGPAMTAIDQDFTPPADIALTVPAGAARRFVVTAHVDPQDPSAARSFRGITTLDLAAGATVEVPVIMNLNETRLVIPDPYDSNSLIPPFPPAIPRIIQIDDVSNASSSFIGKERSDIGFSGAYFNPWAVDFDNRGRIYIANNSGPDGSCVVIRLDNIHDTSCETLGNGHSNAIVAVAVDRTNNYLYYATNPPAYFIQHNLTESTEEELARGTGLNYIESITGLAVDPNGTVYISGTITGMVPAVLRYDPDSEEVTAVYTGYLATPTDVEYKDPYLYVTDSGDGPYSIIQLSSNLEFVAGYGTRVVFGDTNTSQGMFYGPQRFVGIRNDALIIIDEYSDTYNIDKLISMQDMDGNGWTFYANDGKGTGQFQYFYGC